MNHLSVRKKGLVVGVLSTATLLVACEDKRVKELHAGMTRDSVVSVISQDLKPGSPSDSFPNVYARERYLANGHSIEVLLFTPNNEKAGKDTVPRKKLTPLVFYDNKMVGRGWNVYDSVAKSNNIAILAR